MLKALSRSDIERLAQIVREETGNQVLEKNFPMIESRIRTHIAKLGLSDIEGYWLHFRGHEEQERDALQSLMTTHYTFFFREYAHFEVLEEWLNRELPQLKARYEKDKSPVRVWSAACSRGQEVYSLAMFLKKRLDIPFEIVGTDIDAESVAYARNGVYPIKEVNTIPSEYLSGFWKKGTGQVKDFAAAHPSLRTVVRFEPVNLLELGGWSEPGQFDVIFCRNVFIYFSEDNVKRIAQALAMRLRDGGLFVSGMSEPLRFDGWSYPTVGPSCYLKQTSQSTSMPKIKQVPAPSKTLKPVPTVKAQPISSVTKKFRVLCVDDSTTIQMLIKKIFSQDAAFDKVEVAGNGREAREKLDAGNYDLVTLDIHMPEVNGIEFMEKLYRRKTDPPVLMVSSVNRMDVELATKSLSLGAFDYVEKPAMNNLQKSAGEILTKAKMALRAKTKPADEAVGGFDQSISQKIVVPDASQCLRIVVASPETVKELEHVVRAQHGEYRSPALLVLWAEGAQAEDSLEKSLLAWTDRKCATIKQGNVFLKPNTIYLAKAGFWSEALASVKAKSVSLQFLSAPPFDLQMLKSGARMQVLVDETAGLGASTIERQYGLKVSDVTPATSFASLSVEYFANLRKAA